MIVGSINVDRKVESRVAITPENVKKFKGLGFEVLIEKNYAEHIQDVLRDFEDKFSVETIKQIPGREFSKFQKKGIDEGREIYSFKLSLI